MNVPSRNVDEAVLRWRSRRGMLELELLLLPFVRSRLGTLAERDRARYAKLLEHDDWDIFDWIQGRAEPLEPDLLPILADIRAANGV